MSRLSAYNKRGVMIMPETNIKTQRKLNIHLSSDANTKTTLSTDDPLDNLDAETVSTAAESLVAKAILNDSKGNLLTTVVGSRPCGNYNTNLIWLIKRDRPLCRERGGFVLLMAGKERNYEKGANCSAGSYSGVISGIAESAADGVRIQYFAHIGAGAERAADSVVHSRGGYVGLVEG